MELISQLHPLLVSMWPMFETSGNMNRHAPYYLFAVA
jgi:hypothetical protein